ncbi:hypothetical protein NLG97_g9699 [Lecanicillium saksenae]|uniref:Uncharacterized protein n=1 Tax=Lecanicillium saksenae TaxID=468837 RepID=A0ACC1QJ81_9HYPO|nr:hypothetical protein NLG97_g9699 [Lecanicillium saksenae]
MGWKEMGTKTSLPDDGKFPAALLAGIPHAWCGELGELSRRPPAPFNPSFPQRGQKNSRPGQQGHVSDEGWSTTAQATLPSASHSDPIRKSSSQSSAYGVLRLIDCLPKSLPADQSAFGEEFTLCRRVITAMSQTRAQSDSPWRGHFYLPFECGLCACPVKIRSLAYAFVSTPDSMNLEEITRPFVFPHAGTGSGGTQSGDMESIVRIGEWAVGARYNVEPPPPGRRVECSVVHIDCFKIYTSVAGNDPDALRYLWFFSLWRQPWDRSMTVQKMRPLPREGFLCSKPAVRYTFEKLGMPNFLTRLPWEIISTIFDFSRDAQLWRAARAVTIAFERREHDQAQQALVPVLDIKSWQRDEDPPELLESSTKVDELVRFTIDSQGINQIERIERSPELQLSHSTQHQEYVAAEQDLLKSVKVFFKNGRARLVLPEGHPGFTTWNMPRHPPPPRRSAGLTDGISDWVDNGTPLTRMCGDLIPANRFEITYIKGATGITFIFDKNFLAHLHAHTPKAPVAKLPHDTHVLKQLGGSAMEQFSQLAWVYLPLPPGIHQASGYSLPWLPHAVTGPMYTCFGGYSTKPVSEIRYSEKIRNVPMEMTFPQAEAFRLTSYAPLDDVVRLDLVEEPTNGTLRGLYFYYKNGAQRVVGQYRLGYHKLKTYLNPKCLCLRRERQQTSQPVPQAIRATASPSCEEGHETHTRSNGRACYRLTGYVRAQFDSDSILLRFADCQSRLTDAMEGPVPSPPIFEPF